MTTTFAPLIVLVAVFASDAWVYVDARRCADEGAPVTLRVGSLVVERPVIWFVACVLLWIVFFPLYVISRAN